MSKSLKVGIQRLDLQKRLASVRVKSKAVGYFVEGGGLLTAQKLADFRTNRVDTRFV
jgi:hypothetical protein